MNDGSIEGGKDLKSPNIQFPTKLGNLEQEGSVPLEESGSK